jgi:2-methylcitrate dehydratase PrpD
MIDSSTLSLTVAQFVAATTYDDLPERTREMAKRCLLDAVGVSLAATNTDVCRPFREYAIEQGGRPDCTLLGFDARVPAATAAFANGALAHALDYEDSHDGALLHPNAPTIPAVLAISEAYGPISGRDLLTAITLGCEVSCRIGLAIDVPLDRYGWFPPPLIAAFGATAAVGKLLKLDAAQLIDAISLTLCQATCSAELKTSPHSDVRAVRDAFPAQIAVTSALLARRGVRGFDRPLEGAAGFFALYARGAYSPQVLIEKLGERFEIDRISFKPWASCRGTHAFIEAVQCLAQTHGIDPQAIASIELAGSRLNRMLAEPLLQKQSPATAIDAKFSLPFTIAVALRRGTVTLDDFSLASLQDPITRALASRVSYTCDTSQSDKGIEALRAGVTIQMRDGARHKIEIAEPLGSERRPMTDAVLIEKFADCCRRAQHPSADETIHTWVQQILTLDKCSDVRTLVRSFGTSTAMSR